MNFQKEIQLRLYCKQIGMSDEEIVIMFRHGHDKQMAKTLGFALFRLGLQWDEVRRDLSDWLNKLVK